ncbi:hypothetical protein [Gandjariella thermophila]|uniref:Uncharacterized protein n=1 Tax=Gandjariella thermophila TaxID=1931992 RepID=A0A4D4J336_9PSEU|nr:hypothetical protein [Gandjariella thermophila]GDY28896.1 hypothetical protein GTS_05290 [Gandjariella thermophila]
MGSTQSSTDSAVAAADRGFDRALGSAAAGYRLLGWSVVVAEHGIFLELGPTAIAVAMPGRAGSRVLADLKSRMLAGPTLVIPGPQERWVFLAELVALLPTQLQAPADVQLVRPPHRVVLPPTLTQHGPVRWANPPSAARHWLPPFTAVIALARAMASGD